MQETIRSGVRFLGWEDPLEEGTATHFSILAWRIPRGKGAWWATVHRFTKSQTRLKWLNMHSMHETRMQDSQVETFLSSVTCTFTPASLTANLIQIPPCLFDFHSNPAAAKSLQSCPTLCDPIDGSPPGSPVLGSLQARTLEWVAISFSNAWKWKVKVKSLSRVGLLATPWTAAHQAPLSMGLSRKEYWSGVPLPSSPQ